MPEVPTNLDHEILKLLALIEAQMSGFGSSSGGSAVHFADFPLLPLEGLTLSRQSTVSLAIAQGRALVATPSGRSMAILPSGFSKLINANWTPGEGVGGRFVPISANQTLHVFLMRHLTSGAVDIGFDSSPTAANAPIEYATRRIGSLVLNSAGNLPFFLQRQDTIYHRQPTDDYFSSTVPTAEIGVPITVPPIPLIALISLVNTSPAGSNSVLVRSPLMLPDAAYARSTRSGNTLIVEIPTDSAQVRLIADGPSQAVAIFTIGYRQLL
jgi:hypothetical protein